MLMVLLPKPRKPRVFAYQPRFLQSRSVEPETPACASQAEQRWFLRPSARRTSVWRPVILLLALGWLFWYLRAQVPAPQPEQEIKVEDLSQ